MLSAKKHGRLMLWLMVSVFVVLFVLRIAIFGEKKHREFAVERNAGSGISRSTFTTRPAGPFVDRNPGYVGINSCTPCHQERAADFRRTNHFRTCRIPTPDDLPSAFSGTRAEDATYVARFPGTRFRMQQINGQFYQTTIRQEQNPEDQVSSHIDLVLGAGKTDDIYLAWHDDGRMFELPIAWLWPLGDWGASHFLNAHGAGDYSRAMTVRCMECHNTWIQYEPGTVNLYRRKTALLGISCENCHGPARDHVAWHQAHPDAGDAMSIIHPGNLNRERLIEVCTQCHSNAVTHRREPFSYLPGERLEDFYRTQDIEHPEDDHVANQIQHLRKSTCFQSSPDMTCITCHDPHHDRSPDESPAESCLKCHQPHDCGEREQLPTGIRGNCVDCHMAQRIKINVKFQTANDDFVPATSRSSHLIGIDPVARDEVLLKWYDQSPVSDESTERASVLRRRLVDYWVGQAESHTSNYRYLAAISDVREALAIDESPELRDRLRGLVTIQTRLYEKWAEALHLISQNRFAEAVRVLTELLKVKPDDAEAHSKLGTIFAMTGNANQAEEHLRIAIATDPNSAAGYGVLGRLAWIENRLTDAYDNWSSAAEIEPFNAQIQLDLGRVLVQLDRLPEAIEHFRNAQAIDPTRADVQAALKQAEQSRDMPANLLPSE